MLKRLSVLLPFVIAAGCSSSTPSGNTNGPNEEAVLNEVGGLIRMFSGEHGRGPKKAADLARYEAGYPLGFRAVQTGDVVVIWGATVAGEGEANSAPENV